MYVTNIRNVKRRDSNFSTNVKRFTKKIETICLDHEKSLATVVREACEEFLNKDEESPFGAQTVNR